MGHITKKQFDYWSENEYFEQYMIDVDHDPEGANKEIPSKAQFNKPFYEYEDICHLSGPELADGQMIYVEEMDKLGRPAPSQDEEYDFAKESKLKIGESLNDDLNIKPLDEDPDKLELDILDLDVNTDELNDSDLGIEELK